MKISMLLSAALVGLASAHPPSINKPEEMSAMLKSGSSKTAVVPSSKEISAAEDAAEFTIANEFVDGGCRNVIFLYARGSTQEGNIGASPGPQTIDLLKAALGKDNVAAQGLDYGAGLLENILPEGCAPNDAGKFAHLITEASDKCPDSKIVISGYSQGAAVVHAAAKRLTPAVAQRVAAAVTYGDTRKKQDHSVIPPIDPSRSLILCHVADLVCLGTLLILETHFDYDDLAPKAVEFIMSKV